MPDPRPSPPEPAADRAAPPDFDPRVLAALPMVADGSMPGLETQLLAIFARSSGDTLAAIEAAFASGDGAGLLRGVHSLKSASAQVGALALSALAARCERALRDGAAPDPAWPAALREARRRALAAAGRDDAPPAATPGAAA